jgi:DUF1680 family protein
MKTLLSYTGVLAALLVPVGSHPAHSPQAGSSAIVTSRPLRRAGAFRLLPVGAVKPRGWLRRQLQIQAAGLTGHLQDIWPDVGTNSGWRGGTGESWERGPYYVDGLLPLAYLLDDPELIAKVRPWIEWTLTHQDHDGRMGPPKNTDWWPNMVMLKALTQYQEATGDQRVIPFMQRYFAYHLAHAAERPLREWAAYRWGDELVSVLWLYDHTGEQSLLELARVLHDQGTDWKRYYVDFPMRQKTDEKTLGIEPGKQLPERAMLAHGVNNAMALKTSALWYLVSGDSTDRDAIRRALEVLDRYHGLPNGMFSGDEHYAGTDPSEGIELCAVVEALFSLQHVVRVTGDAALADRIERIAFNALPATFTADMWAHKYDQQPNQVLCTLAPRHWSSNGPESNLFGLEPNFGCCTANMHQGWPKLVRSLWMQTPDGGLAAVTYGPNEVRTSVRDGIPVTVVEDTEYPFRDTVRVRIDSASAASFPLLLHVPSWASNATILVNGQLEQGTTSAGFVRIERRWNAGDTVVLKLPMPARTTTWHNDSVAIERGPLVFSLRIGEDWQKRTAGMKNPATPPAADWEVHPTTPWNYALIVPQTGAPNIQVRERPIGQYPFSPDGAPIEITAIGRRLPSWTLVAGSAGPLPKSPVEVNTPDEKLTLIPYGSAKLRVTAFPRVAIEGAGAGRAVQAAAPVAKGPRP